MGAYELATSRRTQSGKLLNAKDEKSEKTLWGGGAKGSDMKEVLKKLGARGIGPSELEGREASMSVLTKGRHGGSRERGGGKERRMQRRMGR